MSSLNRVLALCLLVTVGPACLSGCWRPDQDRRPGYLQVRLKAAPPTLDPALIVDLNGARMAAHLFRGLVMFDEQLRPVPDMAERWTVSSDGLTYSFHLRPGIRFFNGRDVTAEDVRYSFERVLDPATGSPRTWVLSRISGAVERIRGRADHVAGIAVEHPRLLHITLDEPFAPFVSFLGMTAAYIVPREEVERRGADYGLYAGGAGPFMLESWQHNRQVLFTANPHYTGDPVRLAGIAYRIVPEDFTALVEFENGALDVLPEIMPAEYARFAADPQRAACIVSAPALNSYYLGLNCRMPPFSDVRVRRALNHAVDRTKIIRTLLQGRALPAAGPLPPLLRGDAAGEAYAYNPALARKLLAEAGHPDGFAMTIYQAADMESLDICQVLQGYFRDVGVAAEIVQLEWSSFLDLVARGEAQSFWLSWWADYPDAENFLMPLFHSDNWGAGGNRVRFKDDEVDRMLDRAVRTMNDTERLMLYHAAERRIVEQAPWVFGWHKATSGIHQPWVTGYRPRPLAVMERSDTIALEGR